jgi:hypothetical protein
METIGAIATAFLIETGNPEPASDARALAACCGWILEPCAVRVAVVRRGRLCFDSSRPQSVQQAEIAAEVARFVLRRAGWAASRASVETLAPLLVRGVRYQAA